MFLSIFFIKHFLGKGSLQEEEQLEYQQLTEVCSLLLKERRWSYLMSLYSKAMTLSYTLGYIDRETIITMLIIHIKKLKHRKVRVICNP